MFYDENDCKREINNLNKIYIHALTETLVIIPHVISNIYLTKRSNRLPLH